MLHYASNRMWLSEGYAVIKAEKRDREGEGVQNKLLVSLHQSVKNIVWCNITGPLYLTSERQETGLAAMKASIDVWVLALSVPLLPERVVMVPSRISVVQDMGRQQLDVRLTSLIPDGKPTCCSSSSIEKAEVDAGMRRKYTWKQNLIRHQVTEQEKV